MTRIALSKHVQLFAMIVLVSGCVVPGVQDRAFQVYVKNVNNVISIVLIDTTGKNEVNTISRDGYISKRMNVGVHIDKIYIDCDLSGKALRPVVVVNREISVSDYCASAKSE